MKTLVKILMYNGYIIISILFIAYLLIPNLEFPTKPDDSLQSDEPADTESTQRRAYFTNYDRNQVMRHYVNQMQKTLIFGVILPTYRLNYPPEEAQTIIRDQTRSTFLEEIVHPFRESIFVNGFKPKSQKDAIIIQDKNWKQKIIIKQVESKTFSRLVLGLFTVIISPFIFKNFISSLDEFRRVVKRLWIYR